MHKISVVFVCLGNICRSPTAHGVFQHMINHRGYSQRISVDSAGTGDWHLGHAPDTRSVATADGRGIDLRMLRSRLVTAKDFQKSAYIIAMDRQNLADLEVLRPPDFDGHLGLLLDFSAATEYAEVPDPYYSGDQGFELVIDLIESAAEGLLQHIKKHYL
ncbi:MAG: low molecular weight phosphotyrosine protein phosphatase [Porticoccaceae bacterium]|nr:low molecular weight phosphotyrosine protein phosphatase [Porticoccaceae bacterium]